MFLRVSIAKPTVNKISHYAEMTSNDDTFVLVVVLMSMHGVIVAIGIIFGLHRQKVEDSLVQVDTIAIVDKGTYGDCSKFVRLFGGQEVKKSSYQIIEL